MQTIVFSFKKRDWITSTLSAFNRDDFATGTRALFALSIVFWVHWLANWQNELLPVLLGVIASALTETDDHWTARIRYHLIAMCAFLFIALAVWLSLPWPELLAFVIACSAFVLTMLGAIGERYRAIAFGALVFLLYSALSSHESSELGLNSIPLILGGAMWYGVCSILWFAALPQQPVHARLSKLYALLGEYLRLKAQLLEPIREIDQAERRMALVIQNGKVVKALNSTKESLLSRIRASKNPDWLKLASVFSCSRHTRAYELLPRRLLRISKYFFSFRCFVQMPKNTDLIRKASTHLLKCDSIQNTPHSSRRNKTRYRGFK